MPFPGELVWVLKLWSSLDVAERLTKECYSVGLFIRLVQDYKNDPAIYMDVLVGEKVWRVNQVTVEPFEAFSLED